MSRARVDVDAETRRALEFDDLLEWVASFACSAMGRERVRHLVPAVDAAAVFAELAVVAEARRHLLEHGRLLPARLPDPSEAADLLPVEGVRVDAKALRDLATVALNGGELRARLQALEPRDYPRLHELAPALPDLRYEGRAVLDGTDPEGNLLDEASAELTRIRGEKARLGERLQRMLRRLLRDPQAESVIRDDFITQRSGRFVIPVRADAPRPVEGIVHARSSSGATRFVEPLQSVELNNELVRLADREREEEERVLLEWSQAFRRRGEEVAQLLREVSRLDGVHARALFAEEAGAVEPRVVEDGPLELRDVRHPLLDRRLREDGARCIPLDLRLDPADRVLVVSGPNTGGKTVALKTLGLAVLAGQSGIPLTAVEARLPLYRQVRADIGDHQSIEANLSTYSAHVGAVVGFLESIDPPALLLFDELGTGTEPAEGAALARSILETLQVPGVTAVATTHFGALKAWAFADDAAASAAMEFDAESLQPTYRILADVAGTSAGLEIAERLGLPASTVERARGYLGGDAQRSEDYLRRLRDLTTEMEDRKERLAQREASLEAERERLAERARRDDDRRRRDAAGALDAALRDFERRSRDELAGARDEVARELTARRLHRSGRRLEREHARLKSELAGPGSDEPAGGWVVPERVEPGMRVYVRTLRREGEVLQVREDSAEVRLGRMPFQVALGDLRVAGGRGTPSVPPKSLPERERSRPAATVRRPRGAEPPGAAPAAVGSRRDLVLVGRRVEEALEELDRVLDAAVLAGTDEVRVVHGHGTGRLRKAIREFLRNHVHVRDARPGAEHEGGDAATVVRLR